MRELKLIILPSEQETQLLAKDATGATRLRARLPGQPWHAKALPRFLEALGSFVPLRAALVVAAREPTCATKLYPDWFADVGGDNYDLQVIGEQRCERRRWWRR
jgi:hypothetical protein